MNDSIDRQPEISKTTPSWKTFANSAVRWALFSQITLLVYYQIIEWVNLFPWNEIRGGNGQETLDWIVGGVLLVLILVTYFRIWWAMIVAVVLYGLWLWLQIDSWWLPYFKGASPGWTKAYAKFFSQTTNFLPTRGNHLAPDACHVILQLLIAAALITTASATWWIFRGRGRD
jgi:hypothetical protein